jgi:hypothetical protein
VLPVFTAATALGLCTLRRWVRGVLLWSECGAASGELQLQLQASRSSKELQGLILLFTWNMKQKQPLALALAPTSY